MGQLTDRIVMIINGPNLNLLGRREPGVYGSTALAELESALTKLAGELGVQLEFVTSNHEGALVEAIQQASGLLEVDDENLHGLDNQSVAGIVINPAAFTHYSIAIRDALALCSCPKVEVHLSNIFAREQFRAQSVVSPVVDGIVSGLGPQGYLLALRAVVERLATGVA